MIPVTMYKKGEQILIYIQHTNTVVKFWIKPFTFNHSKLLVISTHIMINDRGYLLLGFPVLFVTIYKESHIIEMGKSCFTLGKSLICWYLLG